MKKQRKENGIQDTMGSLFIMIFVFVMLLCYIGFSKSVSMKLQCDNIAKKYLYRMEAVGFLVPEDYQQMYLDYEAIGVTVRDKGIDRNRVAYGDVLTFAVELEFPNPLIEFLRLPESLGIDSTVQYDIALEATAKW